MPSMRRPKSAARQAPARSSRRASCRWHAGSDVEEWTAVGQASGTIAESRYSSRLPFAHALLHGFDPHPRRAHAQPQEHQPRPAAPPADRHHRAVRLGQELARVRHALRRRPAPLRRVAVGVRAAVPAAHGEARRRPDRGPVAGDLDRAEGDVAQPALDGRHGHRDPRLPAPAVRARRRPVLPRPSRAEARRADDLADGRPRARAARGHEAHDPRAGRRQPQGRAARPLRRAARARASCACASTARCTRSTPCRSSPRPRSTRSRSSSTGCRCAPRSSSASPNRSRPRCATPTAARSPSRWTTGTGAPVLGEVRLPDLQLLAAGARAAAVLVQQPAGRVPALRRPRQRSASSIPKRVVAFPQLSLASGAIKGWDRRNQFYFQMLQ